MSWLCLAYNFEIVDYNETRKVFDGGAVRCGAERSGASEVHAVCNRGAERSGSMSKYIDV